MIIRSAHVVPSIGPEAGGFAYSVPRLCKALDESGVETRLHVLARGSAVPWDGLSIEEHSEWCGVRTRLGVSPSMYRSLRREIESGTAVLHNHSLWMMPNVYPGIVVAGTRSVLVTSPRGVFDTWALRRSRWKKRAMMLSLQRKTLERTTCFHATAESEYEAIRRAGLRRPVAVIPNGVDIPPPASEVRAFPRRLLFLGRLHPKKGLDTLIQAWSAVSSRFTDWELHIAGPDEGGYRKDLANIVASLRVPRVVFRGPVYGLEKWREFASASVFVLPTHAENFGVAVAEALASDVPAIVTRGAPWEGLSRERCGWWIELGLEPLIAGLATALSTEEGERAAMGRRGHEWMEREFSWREIGQKMAQTYRWLLDGGAAPGWVRLD